ncbi:MAG: hypothetical protein Q8O75_02190 [bacterium]|nr:hypothetical protein [bacterium]
MKPTTSRKILNVSISPLIEIQVTSIAKQDQKTKSEVVRDAIREYSLSRSLREIYDYGRKQAQGLGIETYEDIEKIAG